jgi:hypothetical protein
MCVTLSVISGLNMIATPFFFSSFSPDQTMFLNYVSSFVFPTIHFLDYEEITNVMVLFILFMSYLTTCQ